MFTLTAMVLICGILTVTMIKARTAEPSGLSEPRGVLANVGVQIICGNCSGEEIRPRRTYLDNQGNCAECGGHSYVLASNLYGRLARGPRPMFEQQLTPGRVIIFSQNRQEKIAV